MLGDALASKKYQMTWQNRQDFFEPKENQSRNICLQMSWKNRQKYLVLFRTEGKSKQKYLYMFKQEQNRAGKKNFFYKRKKLKAEISAFKGEQNRMRHNCQISLQSRKNLKNDFFNEVMICIIGSVQTYPHKHIGYLKLVPCKK